jgi:antirestriction protein ArdC
MAEKQSSRDRLKEITASIEDGIKKLFRSETYAQYLQTMSRFHHYSVNNQVLIHMQKPDATLVAGFNKWKNQFGRNVIKGEHGIKIIAPTPFKKKIEQEKLDPDTQLPMLDEDGKIITEEKTIQIPMYKPVTVFDVSQTEGKPLPQLAQDLSGNVANYDVFMEALRRSSPVPISIEVMRGGMDGYFDLEHQDIAIRKGMSEVQTVSAVIHEMAHALLHNQKAADEPAPSWNVVMVSEGGTKCALSSGFKTEEEAEKFAESENWRYVDENEFEWHLEVEEATPEAKVQSLSRSTEEVQAESISYAVCAYYGITTGENSFGYIASWSKDKTLPELRESLEVISKTADGLINDIDGHYAAILKEREAELIASEPAMAMERLYTVDDRYLYIQRTDTGMDYTIYDKTSMKELDGGQMDMEINTLAEAALEICKSHGIGQNAPLQVADIGILDELQASQDAAISIEPPVQEPPEPETDIPPDPAISVEARNSYGYTDDAMLPLTKEHALELFERDVPVYLLYGDNTEAMVFEQTEIMNHDGIFGIDRADWETVKEQFPVISENKWQKAFLQNPADSYCIYQLRRDPELAELRFMNSHYLREHGIEPSFDHYEAVYSGSFPSGSSTEARLDELYMKFNAAHPQDFTGHSLSVSDIVVLRQNGAVSSYYVESVGFTAVPAFLPENYLKNAEISMEDDYGMIDGIINNGSKEQPEVKPKAPDISALFEAARQVVQEEKPAPEPGKKPSVLAMLHAPAPSRSEKSAQAKSAERDLI